MSSLKDVFWVEKYKPRTINEYIFHDPHLKHKIIDVINNQTIPHMLLSGQRGTGKTAIASIVINSIGVEEGDVLIINASDANSVDDIRDTVKNFSRSAPNGDYKIVLLDEFDFLSINGQAALRKIMVDYADNCRFILICNYLYKVMPEIISRCTYKFHFKAPDKNDIAELLIKILSAEKVTFNLDTIDEIINNCYPDIRDCINFIQEYSIDGKLQSPKPTASAVDYQDKLIDYISCDDWINARKVVCDNVIKDEYENLYRFLYENVNKSNKFKNHSLWEEAICVIAEHEYKNAIVADPEINAAAMLIKLNQLQV